MVRLCNRLVQGQIDDSNAVLGLVVVDLLEGVHNIRLVQHALIIRDTYVQQVRLGRHADIFPGGLRTAAGDNACHEAAMPVAIGAIVVGEVEVDVELDALGDVLGFEDATIYWSNTHVFA